MSAAKRPTPAKKTPCPLAPELQKEIRRLKGKLHAPATAPEYDSMHGRVPLPAPLAWFRAVEWPSGAKFEAKKPKVTPRELEMQFMPVTESYGAQFTDRPFVAVLYDSGQFFYFAALDASDADPLVYHVDHEGEGNSQITPITLSAILRRYVTRMPEAAGSALEIPDPTLKERLERQASSLSAKSLGRLQQLYLIENVTDMTGIEHCKKLELLHMSISTRHVNMRPVAELFGR